MKHGYVYIITNHKNGTLYVGVTSHLVQRIFEHRNKIVDGFSKKYNLTDLVYYEVCEDIVGAIAREKQIKAGSRAKKILLIESMNPSWRDLYEDIV